MKKSKKILFPILFLISLFIFQLPYKGSPAVTEAYAGSLDAPSDFEAEIFRNYVALSWDNESTGYYYTVIEKSVDQGDFYRIATLYKGKTSYKDYSVSNGHVYTYRAQTIYGSSESEYTDSAETVIYYPKDFKITNVLSGQVDLEWSYPDLTIVRVPDYETVIERRSSKSSKWSVIATLPLTDTSFRDTDVSSDSSYYYRIQMNYGGNSYSYYIPSSSGIHTRTAYPLTTGLSGHALSDDRIKLEWDMSNADGGTAILQKLDSDGEFHTIYSSDSNDSYIDSGLEEGSIYTYRLRLRSEKGMYSEFTDEVKISVETVPNPFDFSAKASSPERNILSWTYSYDVETGFEVWKRDDDSWELLASLPKNTDSFTDTNVGNGRTYVYKVRATRGETAFSAFSQPRTVTSIYPDIPEGLVYYTSGSDLFLFSYDDAPSDTTYTLEYKTGLNDAWKDSASVSERKTLISIMYFTPKSEYYFRLRAEKNHLASYSPELHFYGSVPEPVQNFKAAIAGPGRVLLTWEDSGPREEGYYIYRTVNGTRQLLCRLDQNVNSYADAAPPAGTAVRYEIAAYNPVGQSAFSAVTAAVPGVPAYRDIAACKWAQDAINTLSALGAFDYGNGTFYPQKVISRGEAVRLILRSFNIPYEPRGLYTASDLAPSHPYYNDIVTAVNSGLIHPDAGDRVYPNRAVTRREFILLINSALSCLDIPLDAHGADNLTIFSDYDEIPDSEAAIVSSFVGDGILTGKSGRLALSGSVSKAESAVFVYRALKKYIR